MSVFKPSTHVTSDRTTVANYVQSGALACSALNPATGTYLCGSTVAGFQPAGGPKGVDVVVTPALVAALKSGDASLLDTAHRTGVAGGRPPLNLPRSTIALTGLPSVQNPKLYLGMKSATVQGISGTNYVVFALAPTGSLLVVVYKDAMVIMKTMF